MAYTNRQEIVEKICGLIAEGKTLTHCCKLPGMPEKTTFFLWLQDDRSLEILYARARTKRAEALVDEIEEIRQMIKDGKISGKDAKVLINSLEWQASKENYKLYGDKLEVESRQEATISITVVRHGDRAPASIAVTPEPVARQIEDAITTAVSNPEAPPPLEIF